MAGPLENLSNEELTLLLQQYNLSFGPITSSTRAVYCNLLKSRIKQLEGVGNSNTGSADSIANDESNDENNASRDSATSNSNGGSSEDKTVDEQDSQNVDVSEGNTDGESTRDDSPSDDDVFFGVRLPETEGTASSDQTAKVFTTQAEALAAMKGRKGSRFKIFKNKKEAIRFSVGSPEVMSPSKTSDSKTVSVSSEPKLTFSAPSHRDLMKFKKWVEANDTEMIESVCYDNPRYLISSGDTPVILQEGSRLNALHVAVRSNNFQTCDLILTIIQDNAFMKLMYSGASSKTLEFRIKHILDLYLNTPEKILCDTPLHLACKFGCTEIVQHLLQFQDVITFNKNVEGKTCKQVVGDRVKLHQKEKTEEILGLFEPKAYVPLIKEDDAALPKVDNPIYTFSPKDIEKKDSPVRAYLGPMPREKALDVCTVWKKSPKQKEYASIARRDFDKGFERIGRVIASRHGLAWSEYWTFLECFADVSNTTGMEKLENHLRCQYDKNVADSTSESSNCSVETSKDEHFGSDDITKKDEHCDDVIKKKLSFDEIDNTNTQHDSNQSTESQMAIKDTLPNNSVPVEGSCPELSIDSDAAKKDSECELEEYLSELQQSPGVDIDSKLQVVRYSRNSAVDELAEQIRNFHISSPETENRVVSDFLSELHPDWETNKDSVEEEILDKSFDMSENESLTPVEVARPGPSNIFMEGTIPSKHDLDVLEALVDVPIDDKHYPLLARWREVMNNYPENVRNSWPSPSSPRYPKSLQKKHLIWTA